MDFITISSLIPILVVSAGSVSHMGPIAVSRPVPIIEIIRPMLHMDSMVIPNHDQILMVFVYSVLHMDSMVISNYIQILVVSARSVLYMDPIVGPNFVHVSLLGSGLSVLAFAVVAGSIPDIRLPVGAGETSIPGIRLLVPGMATSVVRKMARILGGRPRTDSQTSASVPGTFLPMPEIATSVNREISIHRRSSTAPISVRGLPQICSQASGSTIGRSPS